MIPPNIQHTTPTPLSNHSQQQNTHVNHFVEKNLAHSHDEDKIKSFLLSFKSISSLLDELHMDLYLEFEKTMTMMKKQSDYYPFPPMSEVTLPLDNSEHNPSQATTNHDRSVTTFTAFGAQGGSDQHSSGPVARVGTGTASHSTSR